MKKSSREALSAYYKEAGSWAADRANGVERSRQIAWIIASIAVVVALVEGIALIVLMPLKTVVPYTLLVDRTTGFVQALRPLEADQITPDRALVQSMLVQYVIARESFDIATLETNYQKVGLWSADQARNDYIALMQPSNPEGPLLAFPRSSIIDTRVKSVSPLGIDRALVRFETIRRDPGSAYQTAVPWVAVLRYRMSGEPISVADRFANPLGFQVFSYRRDQEALAQVEERLALPTDDAGALDGGYSR